MLMTVREVANVLHVSVRSVWRLSAAGEIPRPIAVGGSKRWVARQIEKYVEEKATAAAREREKIARLA